MENDDWRAVHSAGHRNFIGGNDEYWERIGALQFAFLKAQGLRPEHYFLDVACGSLRGGVRFIDYLQPDRYLAIDKHIELIIYGVALELGVERFREKRPRFVVTSTFEFAKLGASPDFAIAQSLFTHLTLDDIEACLGALGAIAAPGCQFFATFFEAEAQDGGSNPGRSHSIDVFRYTRKQMEDAGAAQGWTPRYIGDWRHPRGQHIIAFAR
jgi:hypothetical protein